MFLDVLVQRAHQAIFKYPEVMAYLKSRYVTEDEIRKYQIGFNRVILIPSDPADSDWGSFKDECFGGRKLENKIIFPFKDALGSVVGLVGRSIESKEFKVFVREKAKFGGFFFGLYDALPHIYRENRAFLVEGPFDYLAFSKIMPNTVATLTSKISDAQYDFLSMFCDSIVTVFDSDKAGDLGRKKAAEKGRNVRSIYLGFKDPAKMLEDFKMDKFKSYVLKKVKDLV